MTVKFDLSGAISAPGLLWGLAELQPWVNRLSQEERQVLFHSEIHDWVSSMYWGETLGVQYALLMSRHAETVEDKTFWLKTLGEEVDHQQRISAWLSFRGQSPLPPQPTIGSGHEKGR
jgi:hypothetical protein